MEQKQIPQPPVFNQPQSAPQPSAQYQPRVQARPMMEPVEAVVTCLKKFITIKGRARRSEYWWFRLFLLLVSAAFGFLGGILPVLSYVGMVCSLLLIVPQLSAMTRRLHDTGRSGFWALLFALATIAVYGGFFVVLFPILSQLNAEGDPMMLVRILTDAFEQSPIASGVMMIGSFCYVIIGIILIILMIQDSKWTENKYGPSPKYQ